MYDQNYTQDRRQPRAYGAQNVSISSKRYTGQGRNKYQPQPPIVPGVIPDIQKYNHNNYATNNDNSNPNYNRNYDSNYNSNAYSNPSIKPDNNPDAPTPIPMPANYSPYEQPSTMRRMNDKNSTSKDPIGNPPPTADKVAVLKTAEENNDQNNNAEEDNNPPLTRVDFCGIFFSGLAIIVGLGCIVAGILLNYDKKGTEIYDIGDNTKVYTLKELMADDFSFVGVGKLKTDYWGWFERSHDEDFPIDKCDAFYYVLGIGVGSGVIAVALGIYEICKHANRKYSQRIIVTVS